MSAIHQEEQIDCPVCMDCIVGNTNKVVTECGHCFHTNCLMANIAHNGFGCPNCRTMMAEEPEDDDDDMSSVEDSINSSMRGLTEDEYCSHLALISIRRLFREEGDEDDEDDEDEEDEEDNGEPYPKPPIEYLVQKLEEEGFTMERLVKSWLSEHEEYEEIEEECLDEADKLFESLRILISNFVPPQQLPQVLAPVVVEEKIQIDSFMRSSYA